MQGERLRLVHLHHPVAHLGVLPNCTHGEPTAATLSMAQRVEPTIFLYVLPYVCAYIAASSGVPQHQCPKGPVTRQQAETAHGIPAVVCQGAEVSAMPYAAAQLSCTQQDGLALANRLAGRSLPIQK